MKKSGRMKRLIVDYGKALPDGGICTLNWLLKATQKQIDQDLHHENEKNNHY